jgi:NADH:ubiquinone oxidoreductase subunit 5 (subunit L)/multisubunit Na+/H+ antiporter MnhA subunit
MRDSFYTPITEERCYQRLMKVLSPEKGMSERVFGSRIPVSGWLKGNHFCVFKKPDYKNIFFPVYHGTIVGNEKEGTYIQGKISFPLPSIILAVFSFGIGLCPIAYYIVKSITSVEIPVDSVLLSNSFALEILSISLFVGSTVLLIGTIMYFYQGRYLIAYIRGLFNPST